jgi:hypothetical protein
LAVSGVSFPSRALSSRVPIAAPSL